MAVMYVQFSHQALHFLNNVYTRGEGVNSPKHADSNVLCFCAEWRKANGGKEPILLIQLKNNGMQNVCETVGPKVEAWVSRPRKGQKDAKGDQDNFLTFSRISCLEQDPTGILFPLYGPAFSGFTSIMISSTLTLMEVEAAPAWSNTRPLGRVHARNNHIGGANCMDLSHPISILSSRKGTWD